MFQSPSNVSLQGLWCSPPGALLKDFYCLACQPKQTPSRCSCMLSKLSSSSLDHSSQMCQDKRYRHHSLTQTNSNEINHCYGARYSTNPIPKYHLASKARLPSCDHDRTSLLIIFIRASMPTLHTSSFMMNSAQVTRLSVRRFQTYNSSCKMVPRFSTWPLSCIHGCPHKQINSCVKICPKT